MVDQKDDIRIVYRSVGSGSRDGGNNHPFLTMRGKDGWRRSWPITYDGELYKLWSLCQEIVGEIDIWKDSEVLEYVMTGIVSNMGINVSWSDIGNPYAQVTFKCRRPVTKQELMKAYESMEKSQFFGKPYAKKLSFKQLIVLQIYHAMPESTWKKRVEEFNAFAEKHEKLKPYTTSTAEQSMRKDYERALERAKWHFKEK